METTVYVYLKDEGVDVWRPVHAEADAAGFIILGPMPETEQWEFPPGTLVRCETRVLCDSPALVAVEALRSGPSS